MLADTQAVVFDLDGTLLDRCRSFELFVRGQWERFAQSLQAVSQEQYVQILLERDCNGYAPRKEVFSGMVAQFGLPPGLAAALRDDYRARFPSTCVLFPDRDRSVARTVAADAIIEELGDLLTLLGLERSGDSS